MNLKIKNITLTGCLMLLTFFGFATQATAQTEKTPSVDIQSVAQRDVTPDELLLSITLRESDYKGKITLLEKQKELIEVLKKNKINYEEDLTINEMGSTATFKMFSKNPRPRSEATYFLKLYDAGTMQQVVEQLEEQKITNIYLMQTRYTKEDLLKLELGAEAAKKAKVEAENLAQAVGQSIGKAISINSWMSNNSPRPRMMKMAVMATESMNDAAYAGAAPEPAPSIATIRYTVNVSIRFELK